MHSSKAQSHKSIGYGLAALEDVESRPEMNGAQHHDQHHDQHQQHAAAGHFSTKELVVVVLLCLSWTFVVSPGAILVNKQIMVGRACVPYRLCVPLRALNCTRCPCMLQDSTAGLFAAAVGT